MRADALDALQQRHLQQRHLLVRQRVELFVEHLQLGIRRRH